MAEVALFLNVKELHRIFSKFTVYSNKFIKLNNYILYIDFNYLLNVYYYKKYLVHSSLFQNIYEEVFMLSEGNVPTEDIMPF